MSVSDAVPGFDALTGLPDRAAFVAELEQAARADDGVAVLVVDLDDGCDAVLIQVARRLRGAVHAGDMVARIGADEFAVLCAGADLGGATLTAGRLRGALSVPFDGAGQLGDVPVSIGVRVAAGAERDPERLLRDAGTAARARASRAAPQGRRSPWAEQAA
jgi:diguanylate cyclase (GGDEF)-like protein